MVLSNLKNHFLNLKFFKMYTLPLEIVRTVLVVD